MINEEIREKEIRLIGSQGEALGIVSDKEALQRAQEANLDLVMIAPNGKPPVCKIMDYGKYKYEQTKKQKDARKKQKVVDVKEIRMTLNIDAHDLETKAKHARGFVQDGDKVKVSVRFKGREMAHTEMGKPLLENFQALVGEDAVLEKPAKMEGRSMMMILGPKTGK